MKATILLLAMLFTSTAFCGERYGTYVDNPYKPFDASEVKHEEMDITWKRVDNKDIIKECIKVARQFGLDNNNRPKDGCTVWSGKQCIVVTGKSTTMHTLGHEMRHCFQRAWH